MGGIGPEHGRREPITRIRLVERLAAYAAAACGLRLVVARDCGASQTGGHCRGFRCDLVEPFAASRGLVARVVPAVVERQRGQFATGAEGSADASRRCDYGERTRQNWRAVADLLEAASAHDGGAVIPPELRAGEQPRGGDTSTP